MTVTDVRRLWPEVLNEVKGRRRFTWILLSQNAHVVDVRDGVLMLAMAGVGARDSFAKGGSIDVLHEALIEVLGVELRIETMVDAGGSSTSATRAPAAEAPPSEPAPSESPREPVEPAPTEVAAGGEAREQARQQVRPTRKAEARDPAAVDERDLAARPDDSDLDQTDESTTELLARQLGAEIIAEEERAT